MHMQPKIVLHPSANSTLESLTDEFPFLADAVTDHVLGEDWHRRSIEPDVRLLATVAMLAVAGDRTRLKIHAAHALNAGVTQDELKEIVYLTAVHSGFARAIETAQAISELLAERWETSQPIN
jgi:4-carboxymuconolactone decarboxylase